MKLRNLLSQKKDAILKRWLRLIFAGYPAETSNFLEKKSDRFANPVGYTISESIETLFDELLSGADSDRLAPVLDRIIRIRAVQDFLPSQALAFLVDLKKVVREEIGDESAADVPYRGLEEFDDLVDRLVLLALDIYVKCRETIYEIRVKEFKSRAYKLLERADLVCAVAPNSSEGL